MTIASTCSALPRGPVTELVLVHYLERCVRAWKPHLDAPSQPTDAHQALTAKGCGGQVRSNAASPVARPPCSGHDHHRRQRPAESPVGRHSGPRPRSRLDPGRATSAVSGVGWVADLGPARLAAIRSRVLMVQHSGRCGSVVDDRADTRRRSGRNEPRDLAVVDPPPAPVKCRWSPTIAVPHHEPVVISRQRTLFLWK